MAKKKEKTGEEFWRGKCRELEKQLKQLRQELKYHTKRQHLNDKAQDDEIANDSEDTKPKLATKNCNNCGKGTIIETLEIQGRIYGVCNVCNVPERIK